MVGFPLDDIRENDCLALRNIKGMSSARPYRVLVQSPFDDDVYRDSENALTRFLEEKYAHFTRLCKLLGATEVRIEDVKRIERFHKTTFDVSVDANVVEVGASASTAKSEAFRARMRQQTEFEGGTMDLRAAQQLLESTRLSEDTQALQFYQLRCGENPVKKHSLELSLLEESKSNIEVAARIKSLAAKLLKGSAVYRESEELKMEYSLLISVKF